MSDSLSSADRDARIATIADIERRADYGSGNLTGHVVWLCAELRSALSREAAWKAAHDRLFCGSVSLSENG